MRCTGNKGRGPLHPFLNTLKHWIVEFQTMLQHRYDYSGVVNVFGLQIALDIPLS